MSASAPPRIDADVLDLIIQVACEIDVRTCVQIALVSQSCHAIAVNKLYCHPYIRSHSQLSSFLSTVGAASPEMKGLIKSFALDTQEWNGTACIADEPARSSTEEELRLGTELCELLQVLVDQHHLRSIAFTASGLKTVLQHYKPRPGDSLEGFWIHLPGLTVPLNRVTHPLRIDRLVLCGTEFSQCYVTQYIQPQELVLFGCEHAWPSWAISTCIARSYLLDSPQTPSADEAKLHSTRKQNLTLYVGSLPDDSFDQFLFRLTWSLFTRTSTTVFAPLLPWSHILIRIRHNICCTASPDVEDLVGFWQALVAHLHALGLIECDSIEIKPWFTDGANQLEAEQRELSSTAWLDTCIPFKATEPAATEEEWCCCEEDCISQYDLDYLEDDEADDHVDRLAEAIGSFKDALI